MLDKKIRGKPGDLIDDDWFRLHLDEDPSQDDEELDEVALEVVCTARLRRATALVKEWLDTDMKDYRGPADHTLSLESASGNPFAAEKRVPVSVAPHGLKERVVAMDDNNATIDSDYGDMSPMSKTTGGDGGLSQSFGMATLQSDSDED